LEGHFASLKRGLQENVLAIPHVPDYHISHMTPAEPAPAKKKAPAKKAAAPVLGKNLATLTNAGIVPKDYKFLTPAERTALEGLSKSEISAIISTRTKLGKKYFAKHAAHGMYY
jgi:hypothetical protein